MFFFVRCSPFANRLSSFVLRISYFILCTFFFTAYCNCALSTNFVPRTSYFVFRTSYFVLPRNLPPFPSHRTNRNQQLPNMPLTVLGCMEQKSDYGTGKLFPAHRSELGELRLGEGLKGF